MNNDSRPTAEFFVSNGKDWNLAWGVSGKPLPSATVREVPDALLLPLRRKRDIEGKHEVFEGGLCDADGAFVAGRRRSLSDDLVLFSTLWAYPVDPGEIERRDEDVIFGGLLFDHYGHLLTDSTARLWYVVRHTDDRRKIVFLECPHHAKWAPEDPLPLFEMAGIDPARVEIVRKPTRFRRATVPEEAVYSLDAFRPEWIEFFDAVRSRVEPSPYRKVYFSRAHFKRNDVHNEDLFESYWRDLGFHIVHPEDCTLREEIAFASGADEIVATIGTLSHQFLFCKPGAHATVLLRTPDIVRLQLLVGAARGLRSDYVEAFRNVLPTYHSDGVFYLAPTARFQAYLARSGLPPFGKERCADAYTAARVRPYVEKWLEVFGKRPPVFASSTSEDRRARGALAKLPAGAKDPAAATAALASGLASFVLSELRLREQIDRLQGNSGLSRPFDILSPLRIVWRLLRRRIARNRLSASKGHA